jgi:hypothetical protein
MASTAVSGRSRPQHGSVDEEKFLTRQADKRHLYAA